ncbi:MAG: methenyltetrahydromethanopterin cyclohydrolase [Promethearchaeota archaeon]|nr:MAG: methenyltetrahydromethanopterin cyclohydrolase [Candidatus Lokiarchaeota archaeon]
MHHVKVNSLARNIVNKIIENKEYYGAEIKKLENGATVIGMKKGTWEGGRLVGEICMGGLGTVDFTHFTIDNHYIPAVNVYTSYPIISCMASQLAGWSVKIKKKVEKDGEIKKKKVFDSLGSGPARAKSKVEKLFEEIDYQDDSDCAVIVFETSKAPNEEVMGLVADKCGVDTSETYAVYAPTACLTGSIQVAARIVETGIHKLHEIKFPLEVLQDGFGTTTIAPIAKDDLGAMGRTNDSLIAGGMTYYTIKADKEEEQELFELIRKDGPANTSSSYGDPFLKTFKDVNYKFYDIDPGLFAPATYTINNLKTGHSISAGLKNLDLLKESYKLD